MNGLQLDGDLFSPIRLGTSDSDSSDNSDNLSSISNSDMNVTFTRSDKNKHISKDNTLKLNSDEQASASIKSGISNICTPVSKRSTHNPNKNLKALASDLNKVILEKKKDLNDVNVTKRESSSKNSEKHQKKQEYEQKKCSIGSNVSVTNSEQNDTKKRHSRPTSLLLSKNEVASTSRCTKREKNIDQSSKNICNVDVQKSNKHFGKKLIDNSLNSKQNVNVKKVEDACGKSTSSNKRSLLRNSLNSKSERTNQCKENAESTSNPPVLSPYEVSVQKIIHNAVSSECDKMRQNIYSQQMSFYKELNKLKVETERQHLVATERLFKIIEDLMKLNCSVKSASLHTET